MQFALVAVLLPLFAAAGPAQPTSAAGSRPGPSLLSVVTGPAAACRNSVRLTPRITPGPWWQRHRHYLEAPLQVNGSYVIYNGTFNAGYQWSNWGHYGNTTRFGVPTGYVTLNPAWESYYWLLFYNC